MRKKVCSRCGRVISINEQCGCTHYYPKSQKKEKSETTKALSRKRWLEKAKNIKKRDKFLCQRCLIKYKIINFEDLQVHHIKSREHYPELMYEDENLVTLCKTCNLQLGTSDKLDFDFNPKNIKVNL